MILADKIIRLRKRNGWSQEELADKLDVSRQSVSKWESAAAIPSLEKILQLSQLFGVTSDYLLKDEIEDEEFSDDKYAQEIRRVSLDEAVKYIARRKKAAWQIAIATFLCIISPITLIILAAATENPSLGVSETVAWSVGLAVMFALVLCAVPIYIVCGFQNAPYEFLEKSVPFELEYGVRGVIGERKKEFNNFYIVSNVIATCFCIAAPVPLILSALGENGFIAVVMLAVTMVMAGTGAFIFIVAGVQQASFQKLLKEGEYTLKEKKRSAIKEPIGAAYWGIATAVYLAWSFLSNDWHITWLVFAVGGVLFPVVMAVCNIFIDRHDRDE